MLRSVVLAAAVLLVSPEVSALRVVGVGDSLTAGGDWFPYLPQDWVALDFGKNGEESWEGLERFRNSILPSIDPHSVDVVTILYGTNDVRHGAWTPQLALESQKALVTESLEAGFSVVLMVPPPLIEPAGDPDDLARWNGRLEWLRSELEPWAREQGVSFVDNYRAFLNATDLSELFRRSDGTIDGIHPSFPGRKLIAEGVTVSVQAVPEPSFSTLAASCGMVLGIRKLLVRCLRLCPRRLGTQV